MSGFKTWIVDNVVGPVESKLLHPHVSQDKRRDRALELISDDITPQQSIRDIYQRFPDVFRRTAVREKLYERMHLYCKGNYDVKAQEMFDVILRDSPGAIRILHELLCKTSALLFFNNKELYRFTDDNLPRMYKELTDEQKVTFAPKVLQTHGILLDTLKESLRTKELCRIAVNCHGQALEYVPTKWKTKKLMKLAVQRSSYALQNVDTKYQLEMTPLAYKKGGKAMLNKKWFRVLFNKLTPRQKKMLLK